LVRTEWHSAPPPAYRGILGIAFVLTSWGAPRKEEPSLLDQQTQSLNGRLNIVNHRVDYAFSGGP
jgi:hypothetical protein